MNRLRGYWEVSRLKLNLLANFIGTGWSAFLQLASIPLYIRLMGIESYGLIGFYISLQGILQILDFGLSPTLNREMARYSAKPLEEAGEARDLVRTLEVGYWVLGIVIGVALWATSPLIATQWIKPGTLPINIVQQALSLMSVLAILQWPLSFYQSGLIGLQQQVTVNALQVVFSTIGNGGAVLVLWFVSPTIIAFLVWQVVVGGIRVGATMYFLWRSLPPSQHAAQFVPGLMKYIWRFAAGMSGITLSAIVLTQLDKLLLSKLVSLELFGYYSVASAVSNGLAMVVAPIFNVVFPRLSALVAIDDLEAIKRFYHQSAQLMAVAVFPVAATLIMLAPSALFLWTRDPKIVLNAAPIVRLLLLGSALNSIMVLPYSLQLAYGWTKLGIWINIFLIGLQIPLLLFLISKLGTTGAAIAWVIMNGVYLLVDAPLMYRRLLQEDGWRWLIKDVMQPMGAIVLLVLVLQRWIVPTTSIVENILSLLAVYLSTAIVGILSANTIRVWAFKQVTRARAGGLELLLGVKSRE
jgi:O-antigen/teichoic acid export membrane protein